MSRAIVTPNGDPGAAATRLRAPGRAKGSVWAALVPPGAPSGVQKVLPFEGTSVKQPSSVIHKLLPGNAQRAWTNLIDMFAREQ